MSDTRTMVEGLKNTIGTGDKTLMSEVKDAHILALEIQNAISSPQYPDTVFSAIKEVLELQKQEHASVPLLNTILKILGTGDVSVTQFLQKISQTVSTIKKSTYSPVSDTTLLQMAKDIIFEQKKNNVILKEVLKLQREEHFSIAVLPDLKQDIAAIVQIQSHIRRIALRTDISTSGIGYSTILFQMAKKILALVEKDHLSTAQFNALQTVIGAGDKTVMQILNELSNTVIPIRDATCSISGNASKTSDVPVVSE